MKKITLLFFTLIFLCFQLGLSQSCGAFFDGFESGTYAPTWVPGNANFTYSVTTTAPAVGSYCFQITGGFSNHWQGITASYPNSTPSYISVRAKSGSATQADTYFCVGDANYATNIGALMFYFKADGEISFLSSGAYYFHNYNANQWYHIEYKNINWTAKTADIWIDGVQVKAGHAFYATSTTGLSKIHAYNFTSNSTSWFDEVIIGGNPVSLATSSANVSCNGGGNGSATTVATGGSPGYSYLWNTGDTINSISGLNAGTYAITVTDSLGCVSVDSVTISEPTPVATTLASVDVTCHSGSDGSISVAASGGTPGYTVLWSTGDTTTSVSGLVAGSYSVTVSDSAGCSHVDSVAVTQPTPVATTLTTSDASCNGLADGSAMVSASGGSPGYSVLWSTGDTTLSIGALSEGTYGLVVTDSAGCSLSDSAVINEPDPLVTGLAIGNVSCNGADDGTASTMVTGGTPAYSWLWSDGSTTPSLSGLAPGSYSVTVTDSNGCTGADSGVVTEPTALVSSGVVTDANSGVSDGAIDLTVSGGSAPYTFAWSNAATSEDLSGIPSGTYTVTVTDSNGCSVTDTFVVGEIVGIISDLSASFSVYPNPSNGLFNLKLTGGNHEAIQVEVFDGLGRQVKQPQLWLPTVQPILSLDLSSEAKGWYFLKVRSEKGQAVLRLTKD